MIEGKLTRLENALMFNLLNYQDANGWKTFTEIKDHNKKAHQSIKYTSPEGTIHKSLKRLTNKGIVQERRGDIEDKRGRPSHPKQFRLRRTSKALDKVIHHYSSFTTSLLMKRELPSKHGLLDYEAYKKKYPDNNLPSIFTCDYGKDMFDMHENRLRKKDVRRQWKMIKANVGRYHYHKMRLEAEAQTLRKHFNF